MRGSIVVSPPSALGDRWSRRLPPQHEPLPLPRLPASPLNMAANSLIDGARVRVRSCMRLRVVCRGRPEEPLFQACIAEDRAAGAMSYIEFLCHVLIQKP